MIGWACVSVENILWKCDIFLKELLHKLQYSQASLIQLDEEERLKNYF